MPIIADGKRNTIGVSSKLQTNLKSNQTELNFRFQLQICFKLNSHSVSID